MTLIPATAKHSDITDSSQKYLERNGDVSPLCPAVFISLVGWKADVALLARDG